MHISLASYVLHVLCNWENKVVLYCIVKFVFICYESDFMVSFLGMTYLMFLNTHNLGLYEYGDVHVLKNKNVLKRIFYYIKLKMFLKIVIFSLSVGHASNSFAGCISSITLAFKTSQSLELCMVLPFSLLQKPLLDWWYLGAAVLDKLRYQRLKKEKRYYYFLEL